MGYLEVLCEAALLAERELPLKDAVTFNGHAAVAPPSSVVVTQPQQETQQQQEWSRPQCWSPPRSAPPAIGEYYNRHVHFVGRTYADENKEVKSEEPLSQEPPSFEGVSAEFQDSVQPSVLEKRSSRSNGVLIRRKPRTSGPKRVVRKRRIPHFLEKLENNAKSRGVGHKYSWSLAVFQRLFELPFIQQGYEQLHVEVFTQYHQFVDAHPGGIHLPMTFFNLHCLSRIIRGAVLAPGTRDVDVPKWAMLLGVTLERTMESLTEEERDAVNTTIQVAQAEYSTAFLASHGLLLQSASSSQDSQETQFSQDSQDSQ